MYEAGNGSIVAGSLNVDGDRIRLTHLMVSLVGAEPDSIAARLATVLKEAVAEWQTNPGGLIQFDDAVINRQYWTSNLR